MNDINQISLRDKIKKIISEILQENGFNNYTIILFGSRARDEHNEESDWDFLIILDSEISREEKKEISHLIRKNLARIYIDCDVIIKSQNEIMERKNVIGSVIKSAMEEGILL